MQDPTAGWGIISRLMALMDPDFTYWNVSTEFPQKRLNFLIDFHLNKLQLRSYQFRFDCSVMKSGWIILDAHFIPSSEVKTIQFVNILNCRV